MEWDFKPLGPTAFKMCEHLYEMVTIYLCFLHLPSLTQTVKLELVAKRITDTPVFLGLRFAMPRKTALTD